MEVEMDATPPLIRTVKPLPTVELPHKEIVLTEVSDKKSLSDRVSVANNEIVCQGKGRHNMLGSLVIRSCEKL